MVNRTAIGLALLVSATASATVPKVLSFTGTIADAAGSPVPDGSYDVTFGLFHSVSGGTAVWQNVYSVATVSGVFTALLGTNSTVLEPSLFAADQVWLEITVGGDALQPRMRVVSVPYALAAGSLDCVGCVEGENVDATEVQTRVSGSCLGGQAVGAVNQDGSVVCVSTGGGLIAGTGIDISTGVVSTSFTGFSCIPPDKLCGFDASGDPLCCADQAGSATVGFDCPGTDKVHGWDLAGNPLCETDSGGAGGGVTQLNTGGGLTGGPITDTGTVSIAAGGILTSMIAGNQISETVGIPDLVALCLGGTPGMNDSCAISSTDVVLFERMLVNTGIYLFYVHINAATHNLVGGNALGMQLNNTTTNAAVDPDDPFDTWDYIFTNATPTQAITRTFIYEKTMPGLETLEVRAWTNGGTVTIEPYSTLGGHNAGMHVVALKR